jgi:hypothetical protein
VSVHERPAWNLCFHPGGAALRDLINRADAPAEKIRTAHDDSNLKK